MKKRLLVSIAITAGIITIFLVPFIEFVDLGFFDEIAMWIHWPLFGAAFFGDWGVGSILLIILWYGILSRDNSLLQHVAGILEKRQLIQESATFVRINGFKKLLNYVQKIK